MLDHIPDSLAEILTSLNDRNLIEVHAIGGIVLPCTYKIYGHPENQGTVRNALKTAEYGPSDIQP